MTKSLTLNFIEGHITDLAKLVPLMAQGISCVLFARTSEVEGVSEQSKGRLRSRLKAEGTY